MNMQALGMLLQASVKRDTRRRIN